MNWTIWAIIRFFEKDQSSFLDRFNKTQELVENLMKLNISNIQILVSKNEDSIWSFNKLKDKIDGSPLLKNTIKLNEVDGNYFTDVLNYWIYNNFQNWIQYSFIVSSEVWHLINSETVNSLLLSLRDREFCASSAAINHDNYIFDSKAEMNEIQLFSNTCCVWRTGLLYEAWMFWLEWSDWVEEVWPLIRLIKLWYKASLNKFKEEIYYSYIKNSKSYQSYKMETKLIRQVNSYLTFLKIHSQISENTFKQTYCAKKDNIFLDPIDVELREHYQKQLNELIKEWISIEHW